MLPCGLQSFGGPGSGGIPAPPLPHMFPDSPDGRRPLRRPFGKRHVSKSYIRHISYSESLRRRLFLCPGAPLERQPLRGSPVRFPGENTDSTAGRWSCPAPIRFFRPFRSPHKDGGLFAPSGVRFCHFYPGASGRRTPFCRLHTPQPGVLPPEKGYKTGLAAAPTHFVHSLYTSRTKKAQ